jgi:hypothetical protein
MTVCLALVGYARRLAMATVNAAALTSKSSGVDGVR